MSLKNFSQFNLTEIFNFKLNENKSNNIDDCVDGVYVSYVAIELSGSKIAESYNNSLSQNEKLKADYNYEKFKETFEQEMERTTKR